MDGKTRRDGVEVGIDLTWKRVQVRGSYTYTDATILDGTYEGKRIPNVPEHKVAVGLNLSVTDALTLGADCVYVGKRPFESDFTNSFPDQDDFAVLNLKLAYQFTPHIKANLDIRNVTDTDYSEYGVLGGFPTQPTYYPSPERSVFLGMVASF
jgi:iron complex outermembrane receptor protein